MTDSSRKKSKVPAVYALTRASRCYTCDQRLEPGTLIKLRNTEDDREVLCRKCAGLDQFVIVPGGNARLTRLAAKLSPGHHVIMKWSELWKCYERQGLLVEPAAVAQLESELGIKLQQPS